MESPNTYLDFMNEDMSYVIFTYIDDLDTLKSLKVHTPFLSVLTSPYSYMNKLRVIYPELKYNPLKYLYESNNVNTPLEYIDLKIEVFSNAYISIKRRIETNLHLYIVHNTSVTTTCKMKITLKDLIEIGIVDFIERSIKLDDFVKDNEYFMYDLQYNRLKNDYIFEISNISKSESINFEISKIQAFNIGLKLGTI